MATTDNFKDHFSIQIPLNHINLNALSDTTIIYRMAATVTPTTAVDLANSSSQSHSLERLLGRLMFVCFSAKPRMVWPTCCALSMWRQWRPGSKTCSKGLWTFCLHSVNRTLTRLAQQNTSCILASRAGHFGYFLNLFNNKNDSIAIFFQINLSLHKSYLKSPLPVKLTW